MEKNKFSVIEEEIEVDFDKISKDYTADLQKILRWDENKD